MKLRNKKTGEIREFWIDENSVFPYRTTDECNNTCQYRTLKEIVELFEDYEEPKDFWYIEPNGVIARIDEWDCCTENDREVMKLIGNYFETKEEAEKAVEKLKAWKRLKDGGITFKNWTINQTGTIDCFATWGDNIPPSRKNPTLLEDLDLLFGGEDA